MLPLAAILVSLLVTASPASATSLPAMVPTWQHLLDSSFPLSPLEFFAFLDFVRAAPSDLPLGHVLLQAAHHLAATCLRPSGEQQPSLAVMEAIHSSVRVTAPDLLAPPTLPPALQLVATPVEVFNS